MYRITTRLSLFILAAYLAALPACDESGVSVHGADSSGAAGDLGGKVGDGPHTPVDGSGGAADLAPSPCQPPCPAGYVCDPKTKKCVLKGKCGNQKVAAGIVPPNLFITIDRSCSMRDKVKGVRKWDIAVKAVNKLLTTFKGKIRFGLALFPDKTGNKCLQEGAYIAPAPGNETKIQRYTGRRSSRSARRSR